MEKFDIVIIGGGPAGMTAAIYGARSGRRTAVVERNVMGGQVATTPVLENYPGFQSVGGYELTELMYAQARVCGAEFLYTDVESLDLEKKEKKIVTAEGKLEAKAVILAMGAASKRLGLADEEKLTGSGVSYCATCDGAFFKNKRVVVAGSGELAFADVRYLAPLVKSVTLVSEAAVTEDFSSFGNVEVICGVVTKLSGFPLSAVSVKTQTGKTDEIAAEGLFVAIGYRPNSFLVRGQVDLDKNGYILTDEDMRTSVENVFAAGDIRAKKFRQIVTAASDGAIAAHFAAKVR